MKGFDHVALPGSQTEERKSGRKRQEAFANGSELGVTFKSERLGSPFGEGAGARTELLPSAR